MTTRSYWDENTKQWLPKEASSNGILPRDQTFLKISDMLSPSALTDLQLGTYEPKTKYITNPDMITPEFDIAFHIAAILEHFPIDKKDENFSDTPKRVAKAMLNEWFNGYGVDVESVMKTFPNEHEEGGLVVEREIPFYSTCAHHMSPFFGKAMIAYIPDKRVLGLSKFPRLIEIFSRRLQLQELLSKQIADALEEHLQPKGVMVVLYDVQHMCTCSRGVRAIGSLTDTSVVRGLFLTVPSLRAEALSFLTRR